MLSLSLNEKTTQHNIGFTTFKLLSTTKILYDSPVQKMDDFGI